MDRRRYLSTLFATTLLSGCGRLATQQTPTIPPDRDTPPGGTNQTETPTETETNPLDQTYQATELDSVVQELEQGSFTLNFEPANQNADYAKSVIFDHYSASGDDVLNVEIDLEQAQTQRHHNNLAAQNQKVQEFFQGVENEDNEWIDSLYNEYLDMAGGEDLLGLEIDGGDSMKWCVYKDESRDFKERVIDSGFQDLWYLHEKVRFGDIDSAHNQYKAQAYQETETNAGFDTFVWDYGIPGHGLVSAIEHPTRSEDETSQQETYVVETDQGDSQQVATWDNSQYQNEEIHLVREGVNRRTEGFYGRTAMGKDETLFEYVSIPEDGAEQFTEFFREPESGQAHDHLDPMTTAAYIAEENIVNGELDGGVSLSSDNVRLYS